MICDIWELSTGAHSHLLIQYASVETPEIFWRYLLPVSFSRTTKATIEARMNGNDAIIINHEMKAFTASPDFSCKCVNGSGWSVVAILKSELGMRLHALKSLERRVRNVVRGSVQIAVKK